MKLCGFEVGLDKPFFLIAGPCVIESEELVMQIATEMQQLTSKLGINYIFKASKIIESKIPKPKFYIFSNDTMNLENIFDKKNYKIINHSTNKAVNDFYLSTLCKHFIVGPSTFHWWSAYLSKNNSKICIQPTPILNFSSNKDIYPSNWIKL